MRRDAWLRLSLGARRIYHSHYARARWMTQQGYKELLKMPNS